MGCDRITSRAGISVQQRAKGRGSLNKSHLPFYFPQKREFPKLWGLFISKMNRLGKRSLFGGALLPPGGWPRTLPQSRTSKPIVLWVFRCWSQLLGPLPPGVLHLGLLISEKRKSVRAIIQHSSLAWSRGLSQRTNLHLCLWAEVASYLLRKGGLDRSFEDLSCIKQKFN